jgi:lambda repressor-like predicted transcriptional regulator
MYESLVKRNPELLALAVAKVHETVKSSKGRTEAAYRLGVSIRALQYFLKEHPVPTKEEIIAKAVGETVKEWAPVFEALANGDAGAA